MCDCSQKMFRAAGSAVACVRGISTPPLACGARAGEPWRIVSRVGGEIARQEQLGHRMPCQLLLLERAGDETDARDVILGILAHAAQRAPRREQAHALPSAQA